jgi:hypothetical protein
VSAENGAGGRRPGAANRAAAGRARAVGAGPRTRAGSRAAAGIRERGRLAEAAELDARVLSLVGRGWAAPPGEGDVDGLAVRLFEHQFRHATAARRWWTEAGARPGAVRRWSDVPPVPTVLFRRSRVAAFPRGAEAARFLSSGTTGRARSRVLLEDLALYRAAALAGFRRHALPDRPRMRLLFLAPSARAAAGSSLSRMFEFVRSAFGAPGTAFLWRAGRPDAAALAAALARAREEREPVFVLGPAFALVHALDALPSGGPGRRAAAAALPRGSRLFVTGGFKGRSREVEPEALAEACRTVLGVPRERIVHEYGMAELSSQFYAGPDRAYEGPPWVRWRVLDPSTLAPCPPGEPGVLAVWDLANRSTCVAVRTQDLAVSRGTTFELLGRLPGAEPRGCGLTAEAALP